MSDIEDLVIKAIQSYGQQSERVGVIAMAEDLALHIIAELGLKQEFAVAAADDHGNIDDIDDEDTDPRRVLKSLECQRWLDSQDVVRYGPMAGRRFIASRLYTDWGEEKPVSLDPDLVELAAEVDEQIRR